MTGRRAGTVRFDGFEADLDTRVAAFPELRGLRDHGRFRDLERRLGLPPAD